MQGILIILICFLIAFIIRILAGCFVRNKKVQSIIFIVVFIAMLLLILSFIISAFKGFALR